MNKKLISNLITLVFIALFLWYGYSNRELFDEIKNLTILSILLILLAKSLMHFLNAFITKFTLEAYDKKLSWGESLYIGIYGAIGNFFGPILGGAGVRAAYFKKKHGVSISKFSATVMAYYLILFTVNTFLAITSLLFIGNISDNLVLILFFTVWFFAMISFYFVKLPSKDSALVNRIGGSRVGNFIVKHIYMLEEGWRLIKSRKSLVIKLYIFSVLNVLVIMFITLLEFKAVGASISVAALLLYAVFVNISMLLSFTPGSIGIRETLLIMIGATLAVTTTEILQVALVDRAITFILLAFLASIVRLSLTKKLLLKSS